MENHLAHQEPGKYQLEWEKISNIHHHQDDTDARIIWQGFYSSHHKMLQQLLTDLRHENTENVSKEKDYIMETEWKM